MAHPGTQTDVAAARTLELTAVRGSAESSFPSLTSPTYSSARLLTASASSSTSILRFSDDGESAKYSSATRSLRVN